MSNNTKTGNAATRKKSADNNQTESIQPTIAQQPAQNDQAEAKPARIPGLLECCRSSRHKVTTCGGTFK